MVLDSGRERGPKMSKRSKETGGFWTREGKEAREGPKEAKKLEDFGPGKEKWPEKVQKKQRNQSQWRKSRK